MAEEGKAGSEAVPGDQAPTNSELIERLLARAADCGQKSMTTRLMEVIDPVEALLGRGYDRSQVREWLIAAGWRFTPDSFDSALSRVRKRRLGLRGGKPRVNRPLDLQPLTPAHDAEAPPSSPSAAREAAASGEATPSSFADVFLERQDFTAGRRWK